jgi:hypothetical protein
VHREDTQVTDTRERARDIPQLSTFFDRGSRAIIAPHAQCQPAKISN